MKPGFPVSPNKPPLARWTSKLLYWPELILDRLFGQAANPSYQSGVLAVFLLAIVIVTGIPLLFFYRVGAPYQSVAWLSEQRWFGSWLRSLHRYASDACMVAVAVHLLRMLVSGRYWGARARAWISGVFLTLVVWLIGITGLLMMWDQQSWRTMSAGMRFLDRWPIFPDPPSRLLANPQQLGLTFFFLLMFLHVALPLLIAFGLWFHTSKLARPRFWPEKSISQFWGLMLLGLAILFPVTLDPAASIDTLPGRSHIDLFFNSWLLFFDSLDHRLLVVLLGGGTAALILIPQLAAPAESREPETVWSPSRVDETLCTGCTDCVQDCPYDAITMVARTHRDDGRHSSLVARVSPDRCVSCGICAASCAPMGVGPSGRTGRDQLHVLDQFVQQQSMQPNTLVILVCGWGPGSSGQPAAQEGLLWVRTSCSGSLHTSVVEGWLRKGAAGVLVVSCPPRDCNHREGPKWLDQRFHHGREAELQARVDRRRVRVLSLPSVNAQSIPQAANEFRQELAKILDSGTPSINLSEGGSESECQKNLP